jgi:hypothetical protein
MKKAIDWMIEDYKKRGFILTQGQFCDLYHYQQASYYKARTQLLKLIEAGEVKFEEKKEED